MDLHTATIILWSLIVSFGIKSTFTTGSNNGNSRQLNLKELKLGLDVASTLPRDKNYVISPFNLNIALTTIQFGIENTTCRGELAELFNDYNKWSLKYKKRYLRSSHTRLGVKLNFLNAIYYQIEIQLNSNFVNQVTHFSNSSLRPINFKDTDDAVKTINDHVTNVTEGLIIDLIKPNDIDSTTKIVSINTLFFEAPWNVAFDENIIHLFTPLGGEATNISMMQRTMNVLAYYSETHKFKIIAKDYKNTNYKMLVVLPDKNVSIIDVENQILQSPEILKEALFRTDYGLYKVVMPFINMTSSIDMVEIMESKGIRCVFNGGLDGMTQGQLSMSKMIHEVKFETDNNGSRGSAASAGFYPFRTWPGEFIVDRPYLFLVVDTSFGYVHFMGKRVEI